MKVSLLSLAVVSRASGLASRAGKDSEPERAITIMMENAHKTIALTELDNFHDGSEG